MPKLSTNINAFFKGNTPSWAKHLWLGFPLNNTQNKPIFLNVYSLRKYLQSKKHNYTKIKGYNNRRNMLLKTKSTYRGRKNTTKVVTGNHWR